MHRNVQFCRIVLCLMVAFACISARNNSFEEHNLPLMRSSACKYGFAYVGISAYIVVIILCLFVNINVALFIY